MRRRLASDLLVPISLIGLVAVLASLQYRWLGQVSEAEREQLRRSLTQRTREFADDLDQDVSALFHALGPGTFAAAGAPTETAAALVRWRATARYPTILRDVFLAEPVSGQYRLRRWQSDRREFDPVPVAWPPRLEPVRQRLTGGHQTPMPQDVGRPALIALTLSPLIVEVPALLVPFTDPLSGGRASTAPLDVPRSGGAVRTLVWTEGSATYLVLELDVQAYRDEVLPQLLARHFPDPAAYRVAVLDGRGAVLAARGVRGDRAVDWTQADVTLPALTVRLDVRDVLASAPPVARRMADGAAPRETTGEPAATPGAGPDTVVRFSIVQEQRGEASALPRRPPASGTSSAPAILGGQVRVARAAAAWSVTVQHAAGSLDAAVSLARRRNLWLSFGILGVLAVGMALVVINARRSQSLAARQMDFVATVSHELRTPLAVIRSAAQNLAAGVIADPSQACRYGELIDSESRRLGDMVEQVLDYAGLEGRGRVRRPRPVDVMTLIETVAAQYRPVCANAGCTLDLDLDDAADVGPVMGDEAALGRAIGNLVQNAVKHGGDGGWIGVTAAAAGTPTTREVAITVRDRGRGIEPAELPHLFEPFRRGRHAMAQQIHGNGLGLSLVKRIVEAHGGRLGVTSAAGAGAAFVIHLPVAEGTTVEPDPGEGNP